MTPTEIKAKELVEKYYKSLFDIKLSDTHIMNSARQCAIICVDEIIKLLDIEGYGNDYIIKFWQQVLTHLKEM